MSRSVCLTPFSFPFLDGLKQTNCVEFTEMVSVRILLFQPLCHITFFTLAVTVIYKTISSNHQTSLCDCRTVTLYPTVPALNVGQDNSAGNLTVYRNRTLSRRCTRNVYCLQIQNTFQTVHQKCVLCTEREHLPDGTPEMCTVYRNRTLSRRYTRNVYCVQKLNTFQAVDQKCVLCTDTEQSPL